MILCLLLLWGDQPDISWAAPHLSLEIPLLDIRDEAFQRRLSSGLTTSLLLEGELKGEAPKSIKVISLIRFDLWEEKLFIQVLGDNFQESRTLNINAEQLRSNFKFLTIQIPMPDLNQPPEGRLKITAKWMPFTPKEGEKAQAWFSKSSHIPDSGRRQSEPGNGNSRPNPVFEVMMAQSINQPVTHSKTWTWDLPGELKP